MICAKNVKLFLEPKEIVGSAPGVLSKLFYFRISMKETAKNI